MMFYFKTECYTISNLKYTLHKIPTASDFCFSSATDSPGQAMEAEEILKQLDMEQVEGIQSSTLRSTEGLTLSPMAPVLEQKPQVTPDSTIEEGEIVTENDVPTPLPGTPYVHQCLEEIYTFTLQSVEQKDLEKKLTGS